MTKRQRLFLILLITLVCVGCDQTTKVIAKSQLPRAEVLSWAHDTLRLQYTENRGAFLSLGSSLPEQWRSRIFIGAVGIFLGSCLVYLVFAPSASLTSIVSLSLIGGGGLSNLFDRIAYGGYVVDFVNIGLGPVRTGIFNLADVAITVGVLLLVFHRGWRHQSSASD